ncbi:MAG: hypothetical protein J5I81_07250 [Nitrococcus mobilis]|nr:hypothetical protein [Nitrococcus mobilis]
MVHSRIKLDIRYENERIILRGEPALIHQEAERIIERFRFSNHPYRLDYAEADRIELISCG